MDPRVKSMVVVRNVALGLLDRELRMDAMIDSGATFCVVPPSVAHILGFNYSNRISAQRVNVVGGQVMMDIHTLEYLRVGTAQVHHVRFGVCGTGPGSRFMLVGLSFMQHFRTTLDLHGVRVLFRPTT